MKAFQMLLTVTALGCSTSKPAPSPPPSVNPLGSELVAEGAPAPDFQGATQDGGSFKLSEQRGKPVVLYFYPKDFTGGCTMEAQAFRDGTADFEKPGARLVGISLDDVASHTAFASQYHLSYPLVADSGGKIAALYGVDTKSGYAKRVTFVVGPDGKVFKVFPKVNVEGHETEVLAAVRGSLGMN